jgi:GAF domain-containing protein
MNESIHGERTASEPQDRVTELIEQQTAISEVLRGIASSPHDLQPIFDAILDSATRLCRADIGSLRLSEESGLRRVAHKVSPALSKLYIPTTAEYDSYVGRSVTSGRVVHVPDIAALEDYHEGDRSLVSGVKLGMATALFVPMLKNDDVIGALAIWRERVEPFTDKQIELVTDFAAQAATALEHEKCLSTSLR